MSIPTQFNLLGIEKKKYSEFQDFQILSNNIWIDASVTKDSIKFKSRWHSIYDDYSKWIVSGKFYHPQIAQLPQDFNLSVQLIDGWLSSYGGVSIPGQIVSAVIKYNGSTIITAS